MQGKSPSYENKALVYNCVFRSPALGRQEQKLEPQNGYSFSRFLRTL
jgi:hypothetical protein